MSFSAELSNTSSEAYRTLSAMVLPELEALHPGGRIENLRFTNGSIDCE